MPRSTEQKRMFPKYIKQALDGAIRKASIFHFQSHPKPIFGQAAAIEHFVQPSDIPILQRAAEVNPGGMKSHVYRWTVPVEDGTRMVCHLTVPAGEADLKTPLMWPKEPTKLLPDRHESSLIEEVCQWAEHRREVIKAWAMIEGMVDEFDDSGQPPTVLKELWPDFDLLIHSMPGARGDSTLKDFWAEKVAAMPRPRRVEFPVPDTMEYLEDIRSTVLAMTMMPKDLPVTPDAAYTIELSDDRSVELPWRDWAVRNGRPTSVNHHLPSY